MKLYVVELTLRTVVAAEDDKDAFFVAHEQFRDIARDESPDVTVEREVNCERDLPSGWDLECLPYGGDGNTRLSELMENK